jgi:transcriptional regulator with GAF, ATPase, and Fis domain
LQAKLLRAIESNAIQPVGSTDEIRVDVRIMSASSLNLEPEVKAGRFREDLYFRLNVIPVTVPPLRAHPEDIPLLVRHFLDQAGFLSKRIENKGMELLKSYRWPGNIRELKETIEKAATISYGDTKSLADIKTALPAKKGQLTPGTPIAAGFSDDDSRTGLYRPNTPLRQQVIDLEKRLLAEVYERCNGNITQAAKMLLTDRGNLSKKLKKLGVTG